VACQLRVEQLFYLGLTVQQVHRTVGMGGRYRDGYGYGYTIHNTERGTSGPARQVVLVSEQPPSNTLSTYG
jgi:hypothetical protein